TRIAGMTTHPQCTSWCMLALLRLGTMLPGHSPVVQALLGTLFTWGLTAAGSAVVFIFSGRQKHILDGSLGFAAGVMLAASYWSLLAPAVDMAEESGKYGPFAFLPVAVGFALGAAFVYFADLMMPFLGVGADPHLPMAHVHDGRLKEKMEDPARPAVEAQELSIRIGRAGQVVLQEGVEDSPYVMHVLVPGGGIDQDVVYICNDRSTQGSISNESGSPGMRFPHELEDYRSDLDVVGQSGLISKEKLTLYDEALTSFWVSAIHLRGSNEAFYPLQYRTGDRETFRKTRAKLSHAIREAKHAHAQRIHGHFKDTGDTQHMWECIQANTNYRKTPPSCDSDAILPDALNDFYAQFEAQNNVAAEKSIPPQNDQVLCLTAADDIFNISLSCTVVPTCFKTTTIVPVSKKPMVLCLNDYRPIALTSIIMKCFKRLVMRHIKTQLPPSLDLLQFAYRPSRSTDDAISTTVHLALTHLEKKGTYVRMLFIDFSSAFNTIVPQHLIGKLSLLGLNTSLCNWILDFLTQFVRIGSSTSNTTTLSTGAPQGSVLSPLLFTLLTHDCAAMHSLNHIIKFADDTTVVGLINKDNESAYREEVQELIVKNIKFLGVHIAENLTWTLNTSSITKRAQQRLYFLRKLREAHLPSPILTTFYREGLAVGVGFGAAGKTSNLAIGIGIQNFPEGLAVSLPLCGSGMSTWRAFWYGQLSGMVEPLAGLLGGVAVVLAEPLLPYALAFAAGAMVYVVVDDIVPEAQVSGNGKLASWTCIFGFIIMMSLDVGLG
ncbi:hypothetical protein P4O66_011204, partial [Electrophorus voltai]